MVGRMHRAVTTTERTAVTTAMAEADQRRLPHDRLAARECSRTAPLLEPRVRLLFDAVTLAMDDISTGTMMVSDASDSDGRGIGVGGLLRPRG